MNQMPQNGSLYDAVSQEIDAIMKQVQTDPAAVEGLNSNVFGRFFVSLIDTFSGLVTTFGSNLLRITKSIKRSELHEFIDSNRLKMNVVDNIAYARLVGFKVDIPANLQGTYKHAIDNIAQVYVTLNAFNTAKLTKNALTNIFTSLTNEDHKSAALINSTATVIGNTVRASKQTVLDCQANFSGKFQQKATFESIFSTKEEFIACRDALLNLEPRLREAKDIHELVTSMETILKGVCEFMNDNPDRLNQHDLTVFGEMIKSVALIMDGYNLAVLRHLALEHNYVLMVNSIYAGVK